MLKCCSWVSWWWVSPLWHQPTSHRSTGTAKIVVALGVSAMITTKMPCLSWHIVIRVRRDGDKKCAMVDCWSFGLMKACPLYWFLYFAFSLGLASQFFFLVFKVSAALVFATAHSLLASACCCSSLPHGFVVQALMTWSALIGWEIRVSTSSFSVHLQQQGRLSWFCVSWGD